MKITIDTKQDSSSDIKEAIEFLKKFIESGSYSESSEPAGMMNMFATPTQTSEDSTVSDKEKDTEDIQVIQY